MTTTNVTVATETTIVQVVNGEATVVQTGVPVSVSGGGTGPAGPSIVTTKGDLATFDTAVARLPVGSNGSVLLADSTTTTGLLWSSLVGPPSPASTGYVLAPAFFVSATTGSPGGTASNSQNVVRFTPVHIWSTTTVSGMAVEVTSFNAGASAKIRLGLYSSDANGRPGTLLAETSTTPSIGSNGVKSASFSSNLRLNPGLYWGAVVCQTIDTAGTNPAFRLASNAMIPSLPAGTSPPGSNQIFGLFSQSGVTGALGNASPTYAAASSVPTLPVFWLTVA